MINYLLKKTGLRKLFENDTDIAISPDEYQGVFESNVWLLIRKEIVNQIDITFGILSNPKSSDRQIYAAQAGLAVLEWFLSLEESLRDNITNVPVELVDARTQANKLQQVLDLLFVEPTTEEEMNA